MLLEAQLFDAFRLDRQDRPIDGFSLECLPHLRRHLPLAGPAGGDALICFSRLEAGQAAEQIQAQIDHFRGLGQDFEWKVYALEEPLNLRFRLEQVGFVADEAECFMLYPLKAQATRRHSSPAQKFGSFELRRITETQQLDDVLSLQSQVWGRDFDWLRDKLCSSLQHPECFSMFCAYADGQAIGTGWTDYPPDSRFPELHGGSVLAAWRGRGVYSALFEARFLEARSRGYEWMAVDASPMSRPILEAIGFVPICETWPMRYRFASTDTAST